MKTILLVVGRTVEQHYITAINDYIQRLWIFRKGISSSKRKNFNVENDFFASDDPINIRGADLSGNDDTEWRTVSS